MGPHKTNALRLTAEMYMRVFLCVFSCVFMLECSDDDWSAGVATTARPVLSECCGLGTHTTLLGGV